MLEVTVSGGDILVVCLGLDSRENRVTVFGGFEGLRV